ncbi:MAG: Hydrolase alpha/beta hydrolase fold [Rhodospirillaceae bacterium]|nr:MAG: Hydrolase alpha/beta hydrolase fold [Rhodospirillaceae bacterium]TNC97387.1 MAG: Hydrolase, alpha/beta hydrolase fold family [Stygiobacter sp.]
MTDLILLPGLLNDERLWAAQCADLADLARVRVIPTYSHDSIADLARAVLDQAPPRFALAGLSMGGYVSMEILRRAPERVERVALVSTTARPDLPEQTERRRVLMEMAGAGGFPRILPTVLASMVPPGHAQGRVADLFHAMAEAVGVEGFLRQQNAIIGRMDSRPGLAHIGCPALVVVGRDDTLTPPDRAEEMADLIPGAKLVRIADCGHLSAIEQPQAVTAALSLWLQG